jgi:hypothetical protein
MTFRMGDWKFAGKGDIRLLGLRQAAARQSCRRCREQAPGRDSGLDQRTARPPAHVCTENLSSGVVVVKSAEDGV